MVEPTALTAHRKRTWAVVAAPHGFLARVSDIWTGPVRETAQEAYLDGDFTDLEYINKHPVMLLP